jgi:hypothetical protein
MARGKYKKKNGKKKSSAKTLGLSPEIMKETPGDTIPGYCFTDERVCDKIDMLSHDCTLYVDPVAKCQLPNPNYGCTYSPTLFVETTKGFTVTGRKSRKKRFGKVSSRTSGRTKGGNCVASPIQRYCANSSRAYKHPEYDAVMKSLHKRK